MNTRNVEIRTTAGQSELRVAANAEEVAAAGADLFIQLAAPAIAERGRFRVALSGGSTPRRMYELLAAPERSTQVDWDRVELYWGDERYVSAEDRESNYRMTRDALLRYVPVPPPNVLRIRTEISPPEEAARTYEETLRQHFGVNTGFPRFDLAFLGLGTNGHTASLFPHSPVLHETTRLVGADYVDEVKMWRITLTAPVFNAARAVAFLVAGKDKAEVLRDVLYGSRDVERLPAQLIQPGGELLWMVDEAAASLLR